MKRRIKKITLFYKISQLKLSHYFYESFYETAKKRLVPLRLIFMKRHNL